MKALYRAYRPNRFAEVVGQEVAVRILRNAVARDRLAHAYLFSGPRGVGKTTLAKILARAANCRQPREGEPCGVCPECEQTPLHTVEMDAASNRGIDEIRDLRERVRFAPAIGRRRTYILDEAHMLTQEAFNALLKTLEEPPEHLLFILATTEPERIPDTVMSRCQKIQLRRLSVNEIEAHLHKVAALERVEISAEAAGFLAKRAEGSLRDALALLDLCMTFAEGPIGLEEATVAVSGASAAAIEALFHAVLEGETSEFLEGLARLVGAGADVQVVAEHFLDLLRQKIEEDLVDRRRDVQRELESLARLMDATYRMRTASDPQLVFEAAVLPMLAERAASIQKTSSEAAGVIQLDLEQLRTAVRRKSVQTYALLERVAAEYREGKVTLRFSYRGHRILAEQPEHRQRIIRSIGEILGKEVPVIFTSEGSA
jgi:DNA polymerase-3 subunit gamma/tau